MACLDYHEEGASRQDNRVPKKKKKEKKKMK